MAFTKVVGPGIHTLSNILSHNINSSGIITATKFVGPFDDATIGGGTTITSDGINVTGIVTATGLDINGNGDISGDLVLGGDLTVNGTTTTLDTNLIGVDRVEIGAAGAVVGLAVTQSGSADLLRLYDGSTQVFTVDDIGQVGFGTEIPNAILHVEKSGTSQVLARFESNLGTNNNRALSLVAPASDSASEPFTFVTGNSIQFKCDTHVVTIDDDARVGIGTDNPIRQLHVADYGDHGVIRIEGSGNTNRSGIEFYRETSAGLSKGGAAIWVESDTSSSAGKLRFGTASNAGIQSQNTDMILDHQGRVAIGTDTPTEIFHIKKNDTTGPTITLENIANKAYINNWGSAGGGSGRTNRFEINATNQAQASICAPYITFMIGGTGDSAEKARIESSGRLLLGTTSTRETRAGASGYHGQLQMESDVEAALTMTRFGGVHPPRLNLQHARGTIASIAAAQDGDNLGQITFSGWDGDTFTNGAEIISNVDGTPGDDDMPGNLLFKTTPNDSAVPVERLRIKADGKVLVGSGVTDASSLNVKGSAGFADNGTNAGIIIDTDGVSGAAIHCLTTGGFQNGSYSNMRFNALSHKFTYGNTTRLEINSSGKAIFAEEIATPQDYPDLRPTLDFNFAAVKKLDPRIKYYRNGPASYVNEFGRVVLVAENEPRFDHDPTTRKSNGLLIEQLRVNFLANSEFVSSYGSGNSWAYGVGTDVFSASSGSQLSTNPDGSSPAYHYAPSSVAGYHRFNRSFTLDAYDTKYVVSVFAKRVTAGSVSGLNRYLEIEVSGGFANNGAPTGHSGAHGMSSVTFDLQGDGAIQSKSTTANGYVGSPKMEKFADGWWRLSYVFNPGTNDGSSTLTGQIWFGHPDSLSIDDGSETGNGNPSFYLWGAMIEKGGHLTSYIPNHGAYNATRGFDNVVVDGDDFTDFYNPAESTALAVGTMQRPAAMQGQLNILNIGDSNNDGHGVFREHGTKDVFYHIRNNNSTPSGGNLNPSGYGDWDEGEEARIAIAFKDGDQAISVNGGNQVTATVTTNYPTANITKMWIGSAGGNGSGQFEGTISRIAYYPKQLTDNQLNTLTAP